MQKPNEQKRRRILEEAARLFAEQPYHDVRLEDVAARAEVGKGTIYIYFPSKDELYLALVDQGFAQLVSEVGALAHDESLDARVALRRIVAALVHFAVEYPQLSELMRSTAGGTGTRWTKGRSDLTRVIEAVIRRGVKHKTLRDAHPELTALCIPGLVRSVLLFGPRELDERAVTRHLVRLLEHGLVREEER